MLQVKEINFHVIPIELQQIFRRDVLNHYVRASKVCTSLISEMDIAEVVLVDMLTRCASLEIFEDEFYYNHVDESSQEYDQLEQLTTDSYEGFIQDIVSTMQYHSLAFYFDNEGVFINHPNKEVW